MMAVLLGLTMIVGAGSALPDARAQEGQPASEMKSAQPAKIAGESEEQQGRRLLTEMLAALGGDAWLNKTTQTIEGQTAAFFRAEPTGAVTRFLQYKQYAQESKPEVTRVEFISYKGMITPGTKRDVVHLWTVDQGYELTYKGRTELPAQQVTDYIRRRGHSLEEVMRHWVNVPGTVVVYEGAGERDRRPVDKVSVLTANNDAVEIEIEQGNHLPLQRSYRWRNEQFKDFDTEEEVYGDWRIFNGISTPMNMTEYKNGDMTGQTFYKKVSFNTVVNEDLFNPERGLKK